MESVSHALFFAELFKTKLHIFHMSSKQAAHIVRDAKARVVEEFERAYVAGVLGLHGGKLSAAARHADMDNKNLWEKMVRYGLRSRASAGEPPPESTP